MPYTLTLQGRALMKKAAWLAAVVVGLMATVGLAQADDMTINAAGATFPYPIYSQWAHKYNSMTGLKLNYQSIGSGGGIAQIKAKTVDYGARMSRFDEVEPERFGQFPRSSAACSVVNVPGIGPGQLKLTGELLAGICLGKSPVGRPAHKSLNPEVKLPPRPSWAPRRFRDHLIFTSYLAMISPGGRRKRGRQSSEVAGA
jgi:phosphate transport system substrate-binding protein